MSNQYENPPLVEALCEFHFTAQAPWDLTIPGMIYERVKAEFPEKRQQIGVRFQLRPTERGVEPRIEPEPPRVQFWRKDGRALIQVAPNLLVVNHLRPYPTWARFKEMIMANLSIYAEVARPASINRIVLRYLNLFEFEQEAVELKDYFHFYPNIPSALPEIQDSFVDRVEFPLLEEEHNDRLIVTLATVTPRKEKTISVLLELEYTTGPAQHMSPRAADAWLEKAHSRIETAFEASITERAREQFGEGGKPA